MGPLFANGSTIPSITRYDDTNRHFDCIEISETGSYSSKYSRKAIGSKDDSVHSARWIVYQNADETGRKWLVRKRNCLTLPFSMYEEFEYGLCSFGENLGRAFLTAKRLSRIAQSREAHSGLERKIDRPQPRRGCPNVMSTFWKTPSEFPETLGLFCSPGCCATLGYPGQPLRG